MDLTVRATDPSAPETFARSLREIGFAVLVDHPIEARLVAHVYDEWTRFFASEERSHYSYDPGTFAGYYPFRSENARDRDVKDLKEFFHVYADTPLPNGMTDATHRLFRALDVLAGTLLGWLEDATPTEIRQSLAEPLRNMIAGSRRTVLRILHYPPIDVADDDGAVRASAHEDINLLTLLPAGTAPGLELLDARGDWRAVDADPSAIVVNAGDMLALATAGYYRSTTHRVVNPSGDARSTSRYSMPLFLHPRPEVRLSPSRTAGEYLDERLSEIGFGARDEGDSDRPSR